jgi:hypothetical protein
MSILSITFHCTKNNLEEWENYIDETLVLMTENLMDVNNISFLKYTVIILKKEKIIIFCLFLIMMN